MTREAELYNDTVGSPLEAYFIFKKGRQNVRPQWIENSRRSRKKREAAVAKVLRSGNWGDIDVLRDWEVAYRKECFYRGMRILLELERKGKTRL